MMKKLLLSTLCVTLFCSISLAANHTTLKKERVEMQPHLDETTSNLNDAANFACTPPSVDFEVNSNCGTGNTFYSINVVVNDLGSASSVVISDNHNSANDTLTAPGTVTYGPYPYNNTTQITVADLDDPSCAVTSDALQQGFCGVVTDTSTYSFEELVKNVLIGSPCAQVSNVTHSGNHTANNTGGDAFFSIGYFTNESNEFGIDSTGIVLTSGGAIAAGGPHIDGINSMGLPGWPGDDDIDNLVNGSSNNASVLEFDFTPFTDHLSFNYVFASEEYGTFQCATFDDAFAFILTDQDGNTTNLAVVPGTNDPVSVQTIRDHQYNNQSGCPSENVEYFDKFYGPSAGTGAGLPYGQDPINFKGFTKKLTAQADVTPGQPYHIKLVVADVGDYLYDSAVFLEGGSFNIGSIDLGPDLTIQNQNAPCENSSAVLNTGITDTTGLINFSWYWQHDGQTEALDSTGNELTVDNSGTYIVIGVYGGSCVKSDTIEVEFAPIPEFNFDDNSYSLCGSDQVTIDGTPSNADSIPLTLSYNWYFNDNDEPIAGAHEATYNATEPGTYTVEVTTTNGCSATHEYEVTDTGFTLDMGDEEVELCQSEAPYEITATIEGQNGEGASYSWQGPGVDGATTQSVQANESGIYSVTVQLDGCSATDSVSVTFNEAPEFDLGDDITTTDLSGVVLDATPSNMDAAEATYTWVLDGDTLPENGATINPAEYGYGTYTVTVTGPDPTNCSTTHSITLIQENINCSVELTTDKSLTKTIQYCPDDEEAATSYEITFTASFDTDHGNAEEVEFTWYKNGEVISDASGNTYTLTYEDNGDHNDEIMVEADIPNCQATASLTTEVSIGHYEHPCKITEGLSPGNHDGINDQLDLSWLNDRSGIAKLTVFNRYGSKVYEKDNYVDQWHGQDDHGDQLVTGTYYYIIKFKNEDPVFGNVYKGWIFINQKVD